MLRELVVPAAVVGMLASLLLPLPPAVIDLMLVINLLLALVLLITSLHITDPLKLSSLPTILLLATLYRLALNISTTRLILGRGNAGQVIEAFGAVVIQGDLIVGVVVFLIITFIQFVVIAKGAERVAEVSARFTLDALPGKQLSIDADVRAGLIDFEQARKKRHELQIESRFYGALDGAMKFVKGDAIAGIIIAAINIVGGLTLGVLVHGLDVSTALSRYAVLTVGDGLVSQIPALLNSLAAGMVVTRVVNDEKASLAEELLNQLWQGRKVKGLVGVVALVLAFVPGMPFLPFATFALVLFVGSLLGAGEYARTKSAAESPVVFKPRVPPVLQIEIGPKLAALSAPGEALREITAFQQSIYDRHGLVLLPPECSAEPGLGLEYRLSVRGVTVGRGRAEAGQKQIWQKIFADLKKLVEERTSELLDDIHTRRALDHLDAYAPELVSTVVPGVISLTQLTEILKNLVRERVSIRNFDMILQAVAEHGSKAGNERALLEEVRVALKRVISSQYAKEGRIEGCLLDPAMDLAFVRCEREGEPLDLDCVAAIAEFLKAERQAPGVLLVSKAARRLVKECLELRGIHAAVLAQDEIADDVEFVAAARIELEDLAQKDQLVERLAC